MKERSEDMRLGTSVRMNDKLLQSMRIGKNGKEINNSARLLLHEKCKIMHVQLYGICKKIK